LKFFIVLRPWQAFIFLFFPMLLLMTMHSITMIGGKFLNEWLSVIATWVWGFVLYIWIFSIGHFSNQRLAKPLQKKDFIFKAGLAFATAYMVVFALVFNLTLDMPLWLVPFHVTAMAGSFYSLVFTARQLVSLREQREAKYSDYLPTFFLMWFNPIGVWFIQPMVKELLGSQSET
jgi:hypothetical protein